MSAVALAFMILGLLLLPAQALGQGLVELQAQDLTFESMVKELQEKQQEAQKRYSDEYANFKIDLAELARQRQALLEELRNETKRKALIESGRLIDFRYNFYGTLLQSTTAQLSRIDDILRLEDLQLDSVRRRIRRLQELRPKYEQLTKKIESQITEYAERLAAIRIEVQRVMREKNSFSTADRRALERLRWEYGDLANQQERLRNRLRKYHESSAQNSRYARFLEESKAGVEGVFARLRRQKSTLLMRIREMRDDLSLDDPTTDALLVSLRLQKASNLVNVVERDFSSFDTDYAQFAQIETKIASAFEDAVRTAVQPAPQSASEERPAGLPDGAPQMPRDAVEWAKQLLNSIP